MTNTAEPMTLAQVSDSLRKRAKAIRDSEDYVEGITDRMADWFDVRADTIDAELAKQREAESEAWAVRQNSGNLLCCENEANARLTAKTYSYGLVPLYTHSQQRNAVEVTDEMVDTFKRVQPEAMKVYNAHEHAQGRIPRLQDSLDYGTRAALSAVASRDREDAK